MPGIDVAADVSCLALGTGSPAACARTQRSGSNPIGRTTTSSFAMGSSITSASPTSVGELSLDAGGADQLLEVLQPTAALPTERDRVGLAGAQTINESMGAVRFGESPSRPADNLSCSWIVTSCVSLSFVVCV